MSLNNERADQREMFCRFNFPLRRVHTWLGVVCTVPMTRRRIARIELVAQGTQGSFSALTVRIVQVDRGKVDEVTFPFADFLHERQDHRDDYQPTAETFHAGWGRDGAFGWYLAVPTEAAREVLMTAVAHYIDLFER